jgi:metallo-beta-lactamase family protein
MSLGIRFLGAARAVTGSRHLLDVGGRRVLLDCGMVQGPRQLANRLNEQLPLEPRELDAVVLSHAHIDHSGSLPRLVKLGFRGPIYCTPATADLAAVLLEDSARIQAQDAAHLARRGHQFQPTYDPDDVRQTCRQLQPRAYHARFDVVPGVRAELLDAGHILGSAQVVLDLEDAGRRVRLAFTGDHGRRGLPILRDPERLPPVDYLITESTYGDRVHPSYDRTFEALASVIDEEIRDGGRILLPAFSLGRTQNVLYALCRLISAGRIPPLRIWIDSPLSSRVTGVVERHPDLFDAETRAMLRAGRSPFQFEGVRYVEDVEESRSLNQVRDGIIISASGMLESGRVLHHLKTSIGRPEDCVLTVGYMAEGTLGRKLLSGYEHVRIFGERHALRCKVRNLDGLSAHADSRELLEALRHLAAEVRHVFVVHGEEDPALRFADRLEDAGFRAVTVPVYKQWVEL